MEYLFEIRNIYGGYYNKPVIKDLSFNIKKGEFIGIIGPNGSGKTTLLKLATKILSLGKGEVLLEGRNILRMDYKAFCRKVAFVSQEIEVNFPFSVLEIVLMGRIPYLRRMQKETEKDIEIAMDALSLSGISYLKDRKINELSSGERQRVLIARALAQEPVLLILDEPISHLDIGNQVRVLDLLTQLNRQRTLSVVMVMHDLNMASQYCNRIILLDEGMIFKDGTPEVVLTYQNIESVYDTVVVVRDGLIDKRPHIITVSKAKLR